MRKSATELLKENLSKLQFEPSVFEMALDLKKGTLSEPEWPQEAVSQVYQELHFLWEINIPELDYLLGNGCL